MSGDEIALDFDASDSGGSGVGLNSTYNFDDVFTIENQGTQTIYVWANFSDGDLNDDDIWFYPGSDSDRKLNDGSNSVVTLTTGQQVNVGVHIDTSVLSSTGDQGLTATLTADVDVPGDPGSQPSDPAGEDAAVVSKDPDVGEFDSIQGAIDDVDGTTILVEPGRYEESVTIDVDGLTLEGAGADSTTIVGQGSDTLATESDGTVDGVTVRGFTVEAAAGSSAVDVSTASENTDLTFSENTFRGDSGAAATVFIGGDSENVEVDNNTFTAAQGTVDKHLFLGGEATYGSADASATSEADAYTVTNNEFDSFSTTAVESEGQHAAIRQNTFTGAAGETQTAIAVPGPASSSANINGGNYAITGNSFGAEIDTDVLVGPTVNGEVTSENGVINGQAAVDGQPETFDTVQAAVNAASQGATVIVGPGTFDESVTVDVKGLTLEAAEGASPTIDAESDPFEFFGFTHAVAITNDNVEIDGFTVEGTDFSVAMSDAGLSGPVNNPEGAELRNNVLEGGVYHDGSTQFEIIEDNSINGRLSLGGSSAEVIDNDITVDDPFTVISVNSDVVIENNTLNNKDPSNSPYIRDLFGGSLTDGDREDIIADNEFQADGEVANREDLELVTLDTDREDENAIVDADFNE
ncbi:DUF1102 domain-containing protein [Halorubrum ezzemoulense]|uniref:DUF1102 domain-containing protein n=1 Tax=Halorubrum ezzemoulense TaxID=337243 RepID=UPI00232C47B9|nr:DUF1102 domain-containing protein [Halorubrum ezzemoulense]